MGEALQYADKSLKKDKSIVLAAVKRSGRNAHVGHSLEYADKSLKKDKSIVLAAVKLNGEALQHADKSLKKDKSIVLAAVKQNGYALIYADKSLKKDKSIVLAAVKYSGKVLEYADKSLKKDKSIVLVAVKKIQDGSSLQYADKSLKKDKSVVLAAVKHYGLALQYADKSLKKDKSIVLVAAKQEVGALEYADESLKKDKSFAIAAIKQSISFSINYLDESLKKDKSIVLAAVKLDGRALEVADESLKKDKSIVLAAVKQKGEALQYADESLKKDKSIVLAAVKQDESSLKYADKSLINDPDVRSITGETSIAYKGQLDASYTLELRHSSYSKESIKSEDDLLTCLIEFLNSYHHPESYPVFDLSILSEDLQKFKIKEKYQGDLIETPSKKNPFQLTQAHYLKRPSYIFDYSDAKLPLYIEFKLFGKKTKILQSIKQNDLDCNFELQGEGGTATQSLTFRFLGNDGRIHAISCDDEMPIQLEYSYEDIKDKLADLTIDQSEYHLDKLKKFVDDCFKKMQGKVNGVKNKLLSSKKN
jgi:predicted RNA-binding protein (virulence factor B family)